MPVLGGGGGLSVHGKFCLCFGGVGLSVHGKLCICFQGLGYLFTAICLLLSGCGVICSWQVPCGHRTYSVCHARDCHR